MNRYGLGVPNQRAVGAEERSGIVAATGVPWWGAVLIALSATLLGIAIEAGSGRQELGGVFAALYALGCVAAVLAVRRSGLFTAVIQPPLLLFVGVPLAYYLMHESTFNGLKDILITCGYPLIERFPLMLFTSAAVLVVGLVRWYLVMSAPGRPHAAPAATAARPGLLAAMSTKLASAFAGNGSVDEDRGARPARPRHVVDRTGTNRPPKAKEPRAKKPRTARTKKPQTGRDRGTRRPVEDFAQFAEPPRRRQTGRRPAREDQWAPDPRSRSREPRDGRRTPPPPRRDRPDYRDYPPRPTRGGRMDPYEAGRGVPSHPQYGPYPPPRRRPAPNGADNSHHPVSRVRYRGAGSADGPFGGRSEGFHEGPPDAPFDRPVRGSYGGDRDRPPRR